MKADLNFRWSQLQNQLIGRFHKQMNLEALIYLIGLRELGAPAHREFKKEEKVDLMHIAICRLFSQSGYYELVGKDDEGWPHWRLVKDLPHADIFSQEAILKEHILSYFEEEEVFG